ncbi:imm11 family protein [Pararhodobacter sp.]|uniref:imm11 family protein n=1 Tax=Pararhodobacter sp. TaxID=2127056 RepID=UPI002AFFA35F|nr:DUF1629 domain-containing protein [Pararhodobacter sp.]
MTNAWFVNGIQTTLGAKNVTMIGLDPEDKRGKSEDDIKAVARRYLMGTYALQDGYRVDHDGMEAVFRWGTGTKVPEGDTPPPFMSMNSIPGVSAETKALLEQFDLGETYFRPIRILDRNRKYELWDQDYFVLNVCNRRRWVDMSNPDLPAFRPRPTPNTNPPAYRIGNPEKITVSAEALNGPDLWKDICVKDSLFVSPRLAKALKAAQLDKGWRLKKTLAA